MNYNTEKREWQEGIFRLVILFCNFVLLFCIEFSQVLLCLIPGVLWLWHFLYSVGPDPVSSLHIYTFVVLRAFMAGAASQAGDADSSRAPGLTSGFQGSVNVHRGALLLVPQWQCISSFVFYILFLRLVLLSCVFFSPNVFFLLKWWTVNVIGTVYKTFICLKNLNEFFFVFRWRKKGGFTYACICMRTHSLSYRTDWGMLTKLGRDEVIMALHMYLGFLARSAQRWVQGSTKIGQWRTPSPKDFFRSECNSNKPNASSYPELKYRDCLLLDYFHKYGSHAF